MSQIFHLTFLIARTGPSPFAASCVYEFPVSFQIAPAIQNLTIARIPPNCNTDDGSSMFLQIVDVNPQHYTEDYQSRNLGS
jgi:hypothetical protein